MNRTQNNSPKPHRRLWLAYVAPMIVFLGLTSVENWWGAKYYPWLYLIKVLIVSAVLLRYRRTWQDIKPSRRVMGLAIVVGLAVFVEWIVVEEWLTYPHLGDRTGFNPWMEIDGTGLRWLFLVGRFYGLVLMVPLMEELFWRSFLLRYLSASHWSQLRIAEFSWESLGLVTVGFALAHPEWLAAGICALAYGLLLKQTRSLFACLVAHSVTNGALGMYLIMTQKWIYW